MKNKKTILLSIILPIVSVLFITACEINSLLYNPPRSNNNDPGSGNYNILKATFNIKNDTSNVPLDTDMIASFDRPVNPDSEWDVTSNFNSPYAVSSYSYNRNSSCISWNADFSVLTINPEINFPKSSYVNVVLNNFESMDGNHYILDNNFFRFSTHPYNYFNLALNINDREYNVPVNTNIIMTFDRPMNTNWNFIINLNISDENYSNNQQVTYNKNSNEILWSQDKTVLTINPVNDFPNPGYITLIWSGFESDDGEYLAIGGSINFYTQSSNK